MNDRSEAMEIARKARIEQYKQELHDLLIKRNLIKKDAIKDIEEQKINHLKSQLGA